jgi:hypothetical protein
MALQMTLPESSMVVGPTVEDGTPDVAWLEEKLISDRSCEIKYRHENSQLYDPQRHEKEISATSNQIIP